MASPVSQLPPVQPALPSSLLTETEKERLSSQMNAVNLQISEFRQYLISKDMAANTVQVYSYALRQFLCRYHQADFSSLHLYKVFLLEHYKPQTVNLRLRALNAYLEFTREKSKKLPLVRIQQKNYLENVISEADYEYLKSCLLPGQTVSLLFFNPLYGGYRGPRQRGGPVSGRGRPERL